MDVSSFNDRLMDELEESVDRLIDMNDKLHEENKKLKQEVEILTEVIRDLQWKLDGLNK